MVLRKIHPKDIHPGDIVNHFDGALDTECILLSTANARWLREDGELYARVAVQGMYDVWCCEIVLRRRLHCIRSLTIEEILTHPCKEVRELPEGTDPNVP